MADGLTSSEPQVLGPNPNTRERPALPSGVRPPSARVRDRSPPLSLVEGELFEARVQPLRRRWFAGAVLTAGAGGALIAAAIYVSLAQSDLSAPERAQPPGAAFERPLDRDTGRKANRLDLTQIAFSAVRRLRAPFSVRDGARELTVTREFIRVATVLPVAVSRGKTDIPPFDPSALANADGQVAPVEADRDERDADASVTQRDLSTVDISFSHSALTDQDVAELLRVRLETHGWVVRRSRLPPSATRIMAWETSMRAS